MRVVVTGLVATYPIGGVSWDYLAYVDGFRRLGADVFYLEDTGGWFYDPESETFTDHIARNIRYLQAAFRMVDAEAVKWAVRAPDGTLYGADARQVAAVCRSADLFLNVSGCCWLRDDYRGARCTAYLDTDPGYTQAKLWSAAQGLADGDTRFSVNLIREHNRFFTFAEHIAAPDCQIPSCDIAWIPTRQPIVVDRWPYTFEPRARRFTTVMSWKTSATPPLIDGVRYGGKDVEFLRFIDLPQRTAVPLEVAVAGPAPRADLMRHGWHVVDAREKSLTMESYRHYLQQARGEWSVAKNAYVALRSGWFSTRSAAYLALGKPVVVQETGWSLHYPTGLGLLAFNAVEEAVAALHAVTGDYARHCEAARALAEERFSAPVVLDRLLRDAGL